MSRLGRFGLLSVIALGLSTFDSAAQTANQPSECPEREYIEKGARVMGGTGAFTANWPGLVALRWVGENDMTYFCSGMLIARNWVVTARHCFGAGRTFKAKFENGKWVSTASDSFGQTLEIVERTDDLERVNAKPLVPLDKADSIIPHEDYGKDKDGNTASFHNDIALIRLKEPAKGYLMRFAGSGAVDIDNLPDAGTHMIAAGWGLTDLADPTATVTGGGNTAARINPETERPKTARFKDMSGKTAYAGTPKLQEAILKLDRLASCGPSVKTYWASQERPQTLTIWPKQICAGQPAKKLDPTKKAVNDTCSGDSGGPLVILDKNRCPILQGIVSYGPSPCANANSPGVYTRISAYADWIKTHIKQDTLLAVNDRKEIAPIGEIQNLLLADLGGGSAEQGGRSAAPPGQLATLAICKPKDASGKAQCGETKVPVNELRELRVTAGKVGGYVVLADYDASGKLTYLLPNALDTKPVQIKAGQTLAFPRADEQFQFRAGEPFGRSALMLIISPDKAIYDKLQLEERVRSARTRGFKVEQAGSRADSDQDLVTLSVAAREANPAKANERAFDFVRLEYEIVR